MSTSAARTLSVPRATALYVGALFGPGLLLLPGLAAQQAGPASIIAWVALLGARGPRGQVDPVCPARLALHRPGRRHLDAVLRRLGGGGPADRAAAARPAVPGHRHRVRRDHAALPGPGRRHGQLPGPRLG